MTNFKPHYFNLQWHITTECLNRCKHCYLYNNHFYINRHQNKLSIEECLCIVDNFNVLLNKWHAKGHIAFTGGDVFLKEHILWLLIQKVVENNICFSILGNPELLTRNKCERLKKYGIKSFQLSLDGLEIIHDHIRGNGSFKKTLMAICLLKETGINTSVMFTLSKKNMEELIPVMRLVSQIGVDSFGFDREIYKKNGTEKSQIYSKTEYKRLCFLYLKERQLLDNNGFQTKFKIKSNLLNLFIIKNNSKIFLSSECSNNEKIIDGCPIGRYGLAIFPDGKIFPCSRLPIVIGKAPEQQFEEIINSKILSLFRHRNMYEKCRYCSLYIFCRGCPAIAFAATGNAFRPDPHCWKRI